MITELPNMLTGATVMVRRTAVMGLPGAVQKKELPKPDMPPAPPANNIPCSAN